MGEATGQGDSRGSDEYGTPWEYCISRDRDDRAARNAANKPGAADVFDGEQAYDSPIVYWARRLLRRVDALAPWSLFVYRYVKRHRGNKQSPLLMSTRRARYYAEDCYVVMSTIFVVLWSCLNTGLTSPSSWQEERVAWVLLLPFLVLILIYCEIRTYRVGVFLLLCILIVIEIFRPPGWVMLGIWVRWAVPWPLVLRALEIVLTIGRFVNFDSLRNGYRHTRVSQVRYLYYVLLYLVQVSFIYATIYAFWVPGAFRDPSGCASSALGGCPVVAGLNNLFYLSVATITTLGSGFQPSTGLAQWLQMSEVGGGVLLLAVGLAVFVGSIRLAQKDETRQVS